MSKRPTALLVLLVIFTAVLCYALLQVAWTEDHLQYAVSAPAPVEPADDAGQDDSQNQDGENAHMTADGEDGQPAPEREKAAKPNEAIEKLAEQLEETADQWQLVIDRWALFGIKTNTAVSGGDISGESTEARLWLVTQGWENVRPAYLRAGRFFYDDELKRGDRVAVIDEQIALKIFHVTDATDLTIEWEGTKYRVVGVTRHTKKVGDENDAGFYIPLASVYALNVQLDALLVDTVPLTDSGAETMFTDDMTAWLAGGMVINLVQEKMSAWLSLRVLLFVLGIAAVIRLIGLMNEALKRFRTAWQRRIRSSYAIRLAPWAAWRILLLAAGYAGCTALGVMLFNFIIRPIYIFPEWIPSVLVEWDEISKTFWRVWQGESMLIRWQTPEYNRVRFFTFVIAWMSFGAGLVLVRLFSRLRSSHEELASGVTAMCERGAVVSAVLAAEGAEDDYYRLGYARPKGQKLLIRVTDVRKLLQLIPASAVDGSFVLAIEDGQIEENNITCRVTCKDGQVSLKRVSRDYDLKLPIATLAELVYGSTPFNDYLESHTDFDLKMKTAAMEGYFAHKLTVGDAKK